MAVTQSAANRAENANQWPQLLALFVASLFTSFFSSPAYALDPNKSIHQFNCQNWTRQSGLPSDKINAITQSKDGYIWLGTQNGLVRFDGLEWKVVPIKLPEAHGQNIWTFSKSRAGGMWFAVHEGGFGTYDGHRFAAIEDARWTIAGLEANVILEASDGAVWTGGNVGLGRWVPGKPDECLFNDLSNGSITALSEDSESRIWIGTVERGLFFWKDGALTQCPDDTLQKRIIFSIANQPNGNVWVGSEVDLRCYDSSGHRQETPSFTAGVKSLLVDSSGVLWIGTSGNGLARYQNGVYTYFKKADGLVSDHINSLFEDAEGSIWVCTRDGLSQLTDLKFPIYSSQDGLVGGSNLSVAPSQQGGIWITTSNGFCYFDGKTSRNYGYDFPLSNHYVKNGFEARNGDFYAVDGDKNIVVISGNSVSKVYANAEWPRAFAEDAAGVLVAMNGALYRIQDGKLNPFQYNEGQQPAYYWINNLLIATDGAIWVASHNGLIRIKDGDSKRWSTDDGLNGNKVYSICEDEDGIIWAGFATGIVRIRHDQSKMITQRDGLYDDRIYAIVPDNLGAFWIASGHGVYRIGQQCLNDFLDGKSTQVSCDAFDGLESIKFTDRTDQEYSGCKTLDGRIWFPTPQGVVLIDPSQVRINTVQMPVWISRVLANGKDFTQNENAIVSPGDGELEFRFTGLSFIAPHKIRFRYQLDGYDKDWVDAGDRRMAFYTNLKPGNYSFHVIAANADGIWNDTGDSFRIQLLPHFYQTAWFTLVCLGAVFAVLALFYVNRVRHLHLKQESLRKSRDILDAEVRSRTADLADAIISLKQSVEDHERTGAQLERRSQALEQEVEERKRMQSEVERVHQQLLVASRQAGMAEIATNVLHNVGNVLNSVNISASLVAEGVKKSKISNLPRVVAMLNEHASDLATFLTNDVKGKQLISFLGQLSDHLLADRDTTIKELDLLRKNIDHIKHIVAMQQNYAKVSGIRDVINIISLVEDSLRMNASSLSRHGIEVVCEFEPVPELNLDKHKILQILVNLIRNAKYACDESLRADKRMTLRVAQAEDRIVISVIDNGIGIPPENLTRIFNHGFTTRLSGHGFGLHSGALAANEMGGALIANSDGVGQGATFRLELPLLVPEATHEKEPQLQSA
jgi:ligand-binding sensor domain-containing protein/signal transduction histidine kinase